MHNQGGITLECSSFSGYSLCSGILRTKSPKKIIIIGKGAKFRQQNSKTSACSDLSRFSATFYLNTTKILVWPNPGQFIIPSLSTLFSTRNQLIWCVTTSILSNKKVGHPELINLETWLQKFKKKAFCQNLNGTPSSPSIQNQTLQFLKNLWLSFSKPHHPVLKGYLSDLFTFVYTLYLSFSP